MTLGHLHPDDILPFADLVTKMRTVATRYNLPLRTITHLPDDYVGMDTDRHGDCDAAGNIPLALRGKEGGQWLPSPLTPERILWVAAHELAHLKYLRHDDAHAALTEELLESLNNLSTDHRDRVLRKLVKLQNQAASEEKIGNSAAAEAFAGMVNKMLIENELRPADIDYARSGQEDPIIELLVDLPRYGMPVRKMRSGWQESLARVVSRAHLCSWLLRPGSNVIWFVGTKSHATVAEYAYGVLVSAAEKIADQEWARFTRLCAKEGRSKDVKGFRQSWLAAFVERIAEKFAQERASTVANLSPDGATQSTALLRLDGALVKVRDYIDGKFGRRRGSANSLSYYGRNHAEGRAWGRAAADRMTIGRAGIGSPTRGQLGNGE